MPRMPDEQYVLMQENREKSITARSARHARTHCGKSGGVKLPSDYRTKKEIKAMSGECKSYRMNSPMNWAEFRELPDDLKVTYIKMLREKFDVPDTILAEYMGVSRITLGKYIRCLGLGLGKAQATASKRWTGLEKFRAWWLCVPETENAAVEAQEAVEADICEEAESVDVVEDISGSEATESPVEAAFEKHCQAIEEYEAKITPVIPSMGSMMFECAADNALAVLENLLRHTKVKLTVTWEVVE